MQRFFSEIAEGLRIAGLAIWANKLRSVLTTLGIVIGITSVLLMTTIINGIDQQFEKTLSTLGTDVLYVDDWPWGNNVGIEWWNYINRPEIRPELASTIRERSRYAEFVAPFANTGQTVAYKGEDVQANVTGSLPQYGQIRNVELAQGRFLTDSDERSGRGVCVIGAKVAQELFPVATPLNKRIQVGGKPCRVVGVQRLQGEGLFGGGNLDPDTNVIMPFSTFSKYYGMSRYRGVTVMVKVAPDAPMNRAIGELTGIIRTARGVEPGEANNFEINRQERIRESFAPVETAIWGVGLFLTALALVVGGIGVMNIMFVSVRERTKEIGIRKAVGAKKRTILMQFLIEAVIICLLGGALGVGFSGLLAMGVNALGMTAVMPFSTVLVAVGICVGVGLIFGVAPAWQAATADPIEALRYE